MKTTARWISTHLLTTTAIATISGICVAPTLSQHAVSIYPVTIAAGLLFVFVTLLFLKRETTVVYLTLPALLFSCGYLHAVNHLQPPQSDTHIYNVIEKNTEVVILGTLQEMPAFDGNLTRAVVSVHSLRTRLGETRRSEGLVQLSMRGSWPESILPGDTVLVRTEVKRPRSFQTTGSFDYARFLAQKDIWITGYVPSPLYIKKTSDSIRPWQHFSYLPERIRTHTGTLLDENLRPEKAATYRALLLGDRSRLSEDTLERFRASGTFHILAISGLHLSVIALLLYATLYFLLSRSEYLLLFFSVKKIVAALTIPLLIFYAMLAGMNSPVTRAVIMSTVVLTALCLNRKKSPTALVSLAALIILIHDPNTLFTVSFQLSFAAIIGILTIFPLLERILKREPVADHSKSLLTITLKYIISLLLVSVAATLTTAPISIAAFHRLSLIGPLANLLVEPLICLWSLPCGIVAIIVIGFMPKLSILLLDFGYLGFDVASKILYWLTKLPFAFTWISTPPVAFYLFISVSIFICVSIFYRKKATVALFALSLLATALLITTSRSGKPAAAKVTFIDLGQGSSTLIETPERNILIDGGGSSFSKRNVGQTVIAPLLWHKGISKVDTIIITHPDADHYNGLKTIIDHFSPDRIWVRDRKGHDENYQTLISHGEDKSIALTVGKAGDRIIDENFAMTCLANLYGNSPEHSSEPDTSNAGLIFKGCFGKFCFLFPGDINTEMEKQLLRPGANLRADVLLAAHHGAKTSNSRSFLSTVKPTFAVVSAAGANTGYFPHDSFLTNCQNLGIKVLTTPEHGTIEFIIEKHGVQVNGHTKFAANPLYPLKPYPLATLKK